MRRVELEGCFNVRDLGGWETNDGRTVRWRRVYRGDSVHMMTPGDVKCAREDLDIKTVIDLRNDREIAVGGEGDLASGVTRHHFPLSSRRGPIDSTIVTRDAADRSPDTMVANYLTMLEASSDFVVEAIAALAAADALPALFFCAAGKDRTGVLSAVILGALDVRDADVVADYVLTEETIDHVIGRFAATPGSPDIYRDNPPSNFKPHAETMERVVASIRDTYGSFAGYLAAKGLPPWSLESLRTGLLD